MGEQGGDLDPGGFQDLAPTGAGPKSLAAIGERAADAPGPVLAALGARRDPLTGAFRPSAEATMRRVLARVDPDALDQVIGRWVRILAIGILRAHGHRNIAAALRTNARDATRVLPLLDITSP